MMAYTLWPTDIIKRAPACAEFPPPSRSPGEVVTSYGIHALAYGHYSILSISLS